jgi:hypothetical protein
MLIEMKKIAVINDYGLIKKSFLLFKYLLINLLIKRGFGVIFSYRLKSTPFPSEAGRYGFSPGQRVAGFNCHKGSFFDVLSHLRPDEAV